LNLFQYFEFPGANLRIIVIKTKFASPMFDGYVNIKRNYK